MDGNFKTMTGLEYFQKSVPYTVLVRASPPNWANFAQFGREALKITVWNIFSNYFIELVVFSFSIISLTVVT